MTAQDVFQKAVKNALVKDGWSVEDFELKLGDDGDSIGSEPTINAEKGAMKISVLVEPFLSASWLNDFHYALGRHVVCESALRWHRLDRKLFSAFTLDDYQNYLCRYYYEKVFKSEQIRLVVFDFKNEEIKNWIDYKTANVMSPRVVGGETLENLEREMIELESEEI